jgi:hypothetical protein
MSDQKQLKGYISPELKEKFDAKVEKQFGKGKHTTEVIRKLVIKYVDGEIKLK